MNQAGQGLIEYVILVALVAVGTILSIRTLGQSLNVKLANVAHAMGADVEGTVAKVRVTSQQWKKKDMRDFMNGALEHSSGGGSEASDETEQ